MRSSTPIATARIEASFAVFKLFFSIGPFSDKNEIIPFSTDLTEVYLKFGVFANFKLHAIPNVLFTFFLVCETTYFKIPRSTFFSVPSNMLRWVFRTED